MIEDLGHQVVVASSGAEALALLAAQEVDVVVTDQAMPRMTGLELARRIKEARPDLPIVLATGYSDAPPGSGGLFAARIAKPFLSGHLEDALRACRPG
jgi:CheY-like chemotaxis protein